MDKVSVLIDKKMVGFEVTPLNNITAKEIDKHLPLELRAETWGDEIYCETDIKAPVSGSTLDVSVGDIAYWPQGKCLCLFFGRTPASTSDKPMPASEVVIIGKADFNAEILRKVKPGTLVRVE